MNALRGETKDLSKSEGELMDVVDPLGMNKNPALLQTRTDIRNVVSVLAAVMNSTA